MTLAAAADPSPGSLSDIELWRRSFRRRRNQRSIGIALISTLVFAIVIWFGVTHSPGWPLVRHTFFNIRDARRVLPDVLRGLWLNIRILVVAFIAVLGLSAIIATLRTLRGPVFFPIRFLAALYVDVFRGVPLIIAFYLIGFGLPTLQLRGIPTSPVVLGTITLILVYSGYVSEVLRAGIDSVHSGQRLAARSLGLTYRQTLRLVVLPQAVRTVVPPLLNDFVAMQKDVGLISILGAVDAVRAAQIQQSLNYSYTPYTVAALLFILLAAPSARLADYVSGRLNSQQRAGARV